MIQMYILKRLPWKLAGERMKVGRIEIKDIIQKRLPHSRSKFWVTLNHCKTMKTASLNEIIRKKLSLIKNILSEYKYG